MATLDPPFNGLSMGKHDLQVSMLGWHTVGSCNVTVNDPYHFSASGNYNALGQKGTFDFALALSDKNPNATTGPCAVTNAGKTLNGHYTRSGQSITFTDGEHSVTASPAGKSVILEVSGYPKARILG